jgi:hypothetical protein
MPFIPTPDSIQRAVSGEGLATPIADAFAALTQFTTEQRTEGQDLFTQLARGNTALAQAVLARRPEVAAALSRQGFPKRGQASPSQIVAEAFSMVAQEIADEPIPPDPKDLVAAANTTLDMLGGADGIASLHRAAEANKPGSGPAVVANAIKQLQAAVLNPDQEGGQEQIRTALKNGLPDKTDEEIRAAEKRADLFMRSGIYKKRVNALAAALDQPLPEKRAMDKALAQEDLAAKRLANDLKQIEIDIKKDGIPLNPAQTDGLTTLAKKRAAIQAALAKFKELGRPSARKDLMNFLRHYGSKLTFGQIREQIKNPDLIAFAPFLAIAIEPIRKDITGAQFTRFEGTRVGPFSPTITANPDEIENGLNALLGAIEQDVVATLETYRLAGFNERSLGRIQGLLMQTGLVNREAKDAADATDSGGSADVLGGVDLNDPSLFNPTGGP